MMEKIGNYQSLIHFLDDVMWPGEGLPRSQELTPLYVYRFRGPRGTASLGQHQWWELTVVADGNMRLMAPKAVEVRLGMAALTPPRLVHREKGNYADTIWIGFRGSRMPTSGDLVKAITVVKSPRLVADAEALWVLSQRRAESMGPELDASTAALAALCFKLAIGNSTNDQPGDWLSTAIRYIEANIGASLRVSALAQHYGCSEGHFIRAFKARTGRAPGTYIQDARVQLAAQLLTRTDWPIGKIADMVGINDPFYFSRMFHKRTGRSPSTLRRLGPR